MQISEGSISEYTKKILGKFNVFKRQKYRHKHKTDYSHAICAIVCIFVYSSNLNYTVICNTVIHIMFLYINKNKCYTVIKKKTPEVIHSWHLQWEHFFELNNWLYRVFILHPSTPHPHPEKGTRPRHTHIH